MFKLLWISLCHYFSSSVLSWNETLNETQLDENNLYGWEMNQYLPCSGFNWLNKIN